MQLESKKSLVIPMPYADASQAVIAVSVAGVHREPDPSSELVTQALMNAPAIPGEIVGEWTHVTLTDYEGWMHTDELEEPIVKGFCKVGACCGTPLHLVAVITAMRAPLYSLGEGNETHGYVYLSTVLPLPVTTQADRVPGALPVKCTAWLSRGDMDIRLL